MSETYQQKMNTLAKTILALIAIGFTSHTALAGGGPAVPSLSAALKLPASKAVAYRPVRIGGDTSLNFSHIRLGDGSVKPGAKNGVMLVVYAAKADLMGNHQVLFSDFHEFTPAASPVLNFAPFKPRDQNVSLDQGDGRVGIIAILIGLNQARNGTWGPAPLPPLDSISAELTPGDSSLIGLLLPAVQKVRAAAARL